MEVVTSETLESRLTGIEGWLYAGEAWKLYECARSAALHQRADEIATIVEIGSWKGRSTVALGLGVQSTGRSAVIYAIDPHMALTDQHVEEYGNVDTYQEFLNNIERSGVTSVVKPLRLTSNEAARTFAERSIDFLFVDGSHEYDFVKQDIKNYLPLLKDEAEIAFNDPSRDGVYRALREDVLRSPSLFRSPDLVENTLFFKFRRTAPWTNDDARQMSRLKNVLAMRRTAAFVRPLMPLWLVRAGHKVSRKMVHS